jgi:hypothetical protein
MQAAVEHHTVGAHNVMTGCLLAPSVCTVLVGYHTASALNCYCCTSCSILSSTAALVCTLCLAHVPLWGLDAVSKPKRSSQPPQSHLFGWVVMQHICLLHNAAYISSDLPARGHPALSLSEPQHLMCLECPPLPYSFSSHQVCCLLPRPGILQPLPKADSPGQFASDAQYCHCDVRSSQHAQHA